MLRIIYPLLPRRVALAAAVAAFAAPSSAPALAAPLSFDTRALSGQPAPGTEPGVNYSGFGRPAINGAGKTAFEAALTGFGVDRTNNVGLWSEAAGAIGSPALIARTGNAAPGTEPGVNYSFLNIPVLNVAGQTAFLGFLNGTGLDGTNIFGIWSEAAGAIGSPALIARAGDAAPGTEPGVNYSFFNNPVINGAGQTAFFATLTGTGVDGANDRGLWSEAAGAIGSPALIAREGDAAPDTEPGVNYSFFNNPVINGAGQTAFFATLTGTGVDSTNNEGIWSETAGAIGSPALIARSSDAAPGTEPGVNYRGFATPAINGAGQTAFLATLTGAAVDATNDRGIWSEAAGAIGSPALVARTGDAAPGTEPGVNYSSFIGPVLNGAGQTAFLATLSGTGVDAATNAVGIWSEAAGAIGSPALIARTGDAAPGTEPGVNYSFLNRPVLNGAGQTAFFARLIGSGVDSTNGSGIWATDPDGQLTLVIRLGDRFDIDDDPFNEEFRTVASVNIFENTGNEDGRPSSFNDAGQLAFSATFTDGSSGVFVATIPEPTSIALLSLAGLALRQRH